MNTHEMSAMAVIIADVLSFAILCLVIYNLQRKVDKFEKAMANQSLVLKISGNDLIGVLERKKEVKPKIPGTRYKVGSKDEYTMYDGDPKKYYKKDN